MAPAGGLGPPGSIIVKPQHNASPSLVPVNFRSLWHYTERRGPKLMAQLCAMLVVVLGVRGWCSHEARQALLSSFARSSMGSWSEPSSSPTWRGHNSDRKPFMLWDTESSAEVAPAPADWHSQVLGMQANMAGPASGNPSAPSSARWTGSGMPQQEVQSLKLIAVQEAHDEIVQQGSTGPAVAYQLKVLARHEIWRLPAGRGLSPVLEQEVLQLCRLVEQAAKGLAAADLSGIIRSLGWLGSKQGVFRRILKGKGRGLLEALSQRILDPQLVPMLTGDQVSFVALSGFAVWCSRAGSCSLGVCDISIFTTPVC